MRCKAVVLKSGTVYHDVDVNKSTNFPEFMEIWKNQDERKLVNISCIGALFPDDYAEKENEEKRFNNYCEAVTW